MAKASKTKETKAQEKARLEQEKKVAEDQASMENAQVAEDIGTKDSAAESQEPDVQETGDAPSEETQDSDDVNAEPSPSEGDGGATPGAPDNSDNSDNSGSEDVLYSVAELDAMYRIPGWQGAALRQLKGWEKDKRVGKTDYEAALERLKHRPIGR